MSRSIVRQARDGLAAGVLCVLLGVLIRPDSGRAVSRGDNPGLITRASTTATSPPQSPARAPVHPSGRPDRPAQPAGAVVAVARRAVQVRNAPAGPIRQTLPAVTALGNAQVFLVVADNGAWLRVYLPSRPNGSTGWIRSADVTLTRNRYRIMVSRASHTLTVVRDGKQLRRFTVAVGAPATPTPAGTFFVTDRNLTGDPRSPYGPAALGLSGHSDVYTSFGSGDGVIGIHGTDEPGSIGHSVSHGCVRLANPDAQELYDLIPAGTPVLIK